ncbi:hypothetical protein BDBG_17559 [Blastomyces gilchristii SLH14081]|uniref:Uncharacterized protein n=1 Tax=Blastomyces gilchristii (strain SLH14081) TaxID=559298 RepID=A0A179UUK8_BLAGS|nr:uncharacterized protein BDBG_17559 [Blastomyces gilchristii SLH14081]OAT11724.1 hypothetical protein BDBG_17559 [Blastomyces gilchristii SLH14081]
MKMRKRQIDEDLESETLHKYYEVQNISKSTSSLGCTPTTKGHTPFLRKPVWLVTGVWENRDLFFLRQSLLSLMAHWEEFRNGVPCPLSFSEEGLKLHAKEEENMDGIGQLLKISQDQGVLPVDDGMVEHEDYETAKENRIVGNSRMEAIIWIKWSSSSYLIKEHQIFQIEGEAAFTAVFEERP